MRLSALAAMTALGGLALCTHVRGEEVFTNLLPNPSFEQGRAGPAGWYKFGLTSVTWEMHGHEGERALEVTSDGRASGWWSTPLDQKIARNAVYRVGLWATSPGCGDETLALVGLNLSDERIALGPEWDQHEFYFRSPTFLPDPKFRLGLERAQGRVCFDDVRLEPALGVHRSRGVGGGLSLGDGEEIIEGKYTAVHDMMTKHCNDVRFLESFTAQFHDDRWVLHGYGEVVYLHKVRYLGVQGMGPTLKISDRLKYASGPIGQHATSAPIEWVQNDPRAGSHLLQRPLELKVEVGRMAGALSVDICQDGRTWQTVKVIEKPGHQRIDLTEASGRAYELWVRLKTWDGWGTEVTGYRYRSLIEGDSRMTAKGETHYVTVVHAHPELEIGVDDLGELKPGGRGEVKLTVKNLGERVRLKCSSIIEGSVAATTFTAEPDWLAKGSQCRVHIPYEVPDGEGYLLRIMGRDENSGKLLFMFETNTCVAPEAVVISNEAESAADDVTPSSMLEAAEE